jgi:hypothetical protein
MLMVFPEKFFMPPLNTYGNPGTTAGLYRQEESAVSAPRPMRRPSAAFRELFRFIQNLLSLRSVKTRYLPETSEPITQQTTLQQK